MGNVEGASRPRVRCLQPQSVRSRATRRSSPRSDKRQFAGYHAGRTQGADKRLIQIVGRRGLTFIAGFACEVSRATRTHQRNIARHVRRHQIGARADRNLVSIIQARHLRRRPGDDAYGGCEIDGRHVPTWRPRFQPRFPWVSRPEVKAPQTARDQIPAPGQRYRRTRAALWRPPERSKISGADPNVPFDPSRRSNRLEC